MAKVTNTSTMAVNKNMIIPEVYSQMVREKIAGKCHVANMAEVLGDLKGNRGSFGYLITKRFNRFMKNRIDR